MSAELRLRHKLPKPESLNQKHYFFPDFFAAVLPDLLEGCFLDLLALDLPRVWSPTTRMGSSIMFG